MRWHTREAVLLEKIVVESDRAHGDRIPLIDTDVHAGVPGPETMKLLPERWQDYVSTFGTREIWLDGDRPRHRSAAARTDSFPPGGGMPGSNPDFVRAQLLDAYDLSGAVINDINGFVLASGGRQPDALCAAMARAANEQRAADWFSSDPRWYGSITVAPEVQGAEDEIRRCRNDPEFGERWVQVLLPPDMEKPAGHQKYWPIYEAAEHYGLVIGLHVLSGRRITGTGTPNYYLEEHTQFAGFNFPLVASMIFDGVFARFPKLKVALIELAWSWAAPFAWRLDHAYELMRREVSHLPRKPSEYMAEHFWFSTQPMEEPESLEWFDDVYQLLEDTLGDKLMYSSDYPHWDFDEPSVLPATLPTHTRRKILGQTASSLYGIPLRENSGLVLEHATA